MSYDGHPDQCWGPTTYAQHGDDLFLMNLFALIGIPCPSYLDIGAHHPKNISNTALMYERHCSGVNVEANPNLMERFLKERPFDTNVNVGVSVFEGDLNFFMYDSESGRNTFSVEEMTAFLKENPSHYVGETRKIKVITLNQVVDSYCGGVFPDFLNMDIEGLDFDVLASADFSRNQPKIVCVEVRNEQSQKFKDMMRDKGYFCVARLWANLVFVRLDYEGLVR